MQLAAYRVELGEVESDDLEKIRVWCAPVAEVLHGAEILNEADKAHVARFYQQADRERITAARILLRQALSHETGTQLAPSAWRFRIGPNGKPLMAEGLPPLHFNLSHAAGAVAVAVGSKLPLGIDIESIAPDERADILADVLTFRELTRLKGLNGLARWTEFMRIWTLKEACAKAMGLGMSFDFRRMEVDRSRAKVRLIDRPPGRRLEIEAATTTVERGGRPYSLSIATIDTDQPELLAEALEGPSDPAP
jgi:phosphopantetheinyl transferase